MRCVAFLVIAVVLGACARDPYVTNSGEIEAGSWRIARQIDRVIASQLPSATVISWGSNTYVPGVKYATLQLTCHDGQPLVRFGFDFKIGSDRNTFFGYRFDDKPGRDGVESRVLRGYQVIVIEEQAAVAQFLTDLKGSRRLYMRLRSLTGGRTSAEFPVDGSDAAVQAAFTECSGSVPRAPASASIY